MREVAVKTLNLRKEYDGFVAVDGINLEIYRGEIFGLLGPNGAGKTTTISMLLGLIPPTEGDAWVDGFSIRKDPIEVRRRVGFLAENLGFYDNMTAWENLIITAKLNKVENPKERIEKLLRRVGLSNWADVEVGKFSRGMKQRLGIADALLKKPSVLILDEPTSGIDPRGAEEILSIIQSLAREEKITILMSSHLLHQVEKICDRVAIMDKGKIIAQGTLKDLIGEKYRIEIETDKMSNDILEDLRNLGEVEVEERKVRITADKDIRREVSAILYAKGAIVLDLHISRPSLAEIYRELLEKEPR